MGCYCFCMLITINSSSVLLLRICRERKDEKFECFG